MLRINETVDFKEIPIGHCFEFAGERCLKVKEYTKPCGTVRNALDLSPLECGGMILDLGRTMYDENLRYLGRLCKMA